MHGLAGQATERSCSKEADGSLDAAEGMRLRANIWFQDRDLPEGAKVRLEVLEEN
jgi:hypothetical protein